MATNIKDDDFEQEVLKSDTPVIVDFWAEWCQPCKALSPLIDQLAESKKDKVKVVKVNIDENPNSPTTYGVRSIPTLMLFKGGELIETRVGGMSEAQLDEWVEAVV